MNLSKLDTVFSTYIRMRDADEYGRVQCCTCSTVAHWSEMDCGHFISRYNLSTRFDERNCHAQCKICNQFHGGMQFEHELYIEVRYGMIIPYELEQLSHKATYLMQHEIDELIEVYKQKIKNLEP